MLLNVCKASGVEEIKSSTGSVREGTNPHPHTFSYWLVNYPYKIMKWLELAGKRDTVLARKLVLVFHVITKQSKYMGNIFIPLLPHHLGCME